MKKILPLLLALILLSGCSNQSSSFDKMLHDSMTDALSHNGLNTHYYLKNPAAFGIRNPPKTLGRIDFDDIDGMKSYYESAKELAKYDSEELTDSQQLTFDVLSANLEIMQKGVGFGYYDELFYPRTGVQSNLPILLAEYRIENEKDIKSYLALLEDFPDYFADLLKYEKQHAAMGFFLTEKMVDETVAVCEQFIARPDENVLISSFKERIAELDLSSEKVDKYITKNTTLVMGSVIPEYKTLIKWLTDIREMGVNDGGLCNILKGDKYYEYLMAQSSGSDKTVDEIASMLDNYIVKSDTELRAIVEKNSEIYTSDSVDYAAITVEECLARLKASLKADFPPIHEVEMQVKYLPKSLQNMATGAFYLTPPLDAPSENIIYINENQPSAELFPLLAHEGYPGHLYQTVYFNGVNDVPLRNVMGFLGYSEGWATYVEQASYAWAGNNSDDVVRFTNLAKTKSMAMMARMEIGIHYNGWDRGKFAAYYATFGVTDPISVEAMYEYCLTDPVGHIPYIVGYLELTQIRRDMEEKLGANFNLKDFHKAVLDVGPAPFSVVRKYVEKALVA